METHNVPLQKKGMQNLNAKKTCKKTTIDTKIAWVCIETPHALAHKMRMEEKCRGNTKISHVTKKNAFWMAYAYCNQFFLCLALVRHLTYYKKMAAFIASHGTSHIDPHNKEDRNDPSPPIKSSWFNYEMCNMTALLQNWRVLPFGTCVATLASSSLFIWSFFHLSKGYER